MVKSIKGYRDQANGKYACAQFVFIRGLGEKDGGRRDYQGSRIDSTSCLYAFCFISCSCSCCPSRINDMAEAATIKDVLCDECFPLVVTHEAFALSE